MSKNRFIILFILIVIFFAIAVAWQPYNLKFSVPTNNPIMSYLLDSGYLSKTKVKDGQYNVDKTLNPPTILGNTPATKLGLDLAGGSYISLKADMTNVPDNEKVEKLSVVRKIVEGRVNAFGVSETNVYQSISGNDYKIIVEIPGEGKDVESKIDSLKQSAKLEFLQVKKDPGNVDLSSIPFYYEHLFLGEATGLTGQYVKNAIAYYPNQNPVSMLNAGQPIVGTKWIDITFTDEGAQKFKELTDRMRGKKTYITFDGELLSSPNIPQDYQQTGNSTTIQGQFDPKVADQIASLIRAGALPVPLSVVEVRTIDASLGKDAVDKSIYAGILGIIAVMVFMILNYKKEGVVASIALIFYTLLSFAFFRYFGIALTLAGIAGFIISVGMAVDANILIFERMKEELKKGNSKEKSLELGFLRAWTSIRDSNMSTLLTCLILFSFGSTITKGFAFNLALGVLISMFTAIFITKQLLKLIEHNKK